MEKISRFERQVPRFHPERGSSKSSTPAPKPPKKFTAKDVEAAARMLRDPNFRSRKWLKPGEKKLLKEVDVWGRKAWKKGETGISKERFTAIIKGIKQEAGEQGQRIRPMFRGGKTPKEIERSYEQEKRKEWERANPAKDKPEEDKQSQQRLAEAKARVAEAQARPQVAPAEQPMTPRSPWEDAPSPATAPAESTVVPLAGTVTPEEHPGAPASSEPTIIPPAPSSVNVNADVPMPETTAPQTPAAADNEGVSPTPADTDDAPPSADAAHDLDIG